MKAFGHLNRMEVTHEFHTDCVKVSLEVYVPRIHAAEWHTLLSRNPRMIGVFDADEVPVVPPSVVPYNAHVSESNPEAGSW